MTGAVERVGKEKTRVRFLVAIRSAVGAVVVLLLVGACGSDDSGGERLFCETDGDCGAGKSCVSGRCTGGTGGAGGGSSGSGGGGSCVEVGLTCSKPVDCCSAQSRSGTCVNLGASYGTRCGVYCNSGSECNSGCCVPLEGDTRGVCAPDEFCGDN